MGNNALALLGVAAVAMSLGAAGVAQASDDPPAAAGSGMRQYLDKEGRSIVPPPEEPVAEPPPPQLPARRAPRAVPEPAPGGGEMIRNDRVHYSRARVGKDGRITVDCVPGRPEGTGPADK